MRKTLAILFGSAVCCLCSTTSYANNQVTADPVQLAIKALNLPDYEGYKEGKRQKVCILCAHPAQARWKEITKNPSSSLNKLNYDLTFIDLCDHIGMGPNNNGFDKEIKEMGYELLGGYELQREGTTERLVTLGRRIATDRIAFGEVRNLLFVYKKDSTVVIKCDLTSEIFQKYAEKHLKNRFDAIIGDSFVGVCTAIFPSWTIASLIASLKNGGAFLLPDHDIEELNTKNLFWSAITGRSNLWVPVIRILPSYLPWNISGEKGNLRISSENQNFVLPHNAFIDSWNVDANTTTICEIDGKLSKLLLEPIIIDYTPLGLNQDPFISPRMVIAKFDPNLNEAVSPDTDNWPYDNFEPDWSDTISSDSSDFDCFFPYDSQDGGSDYADASSELQDSDSIDDPQDEGSDYADASSELQDSGSIDDPQE